MGYKVMVLVIVVTVSCSYGSCSWWFWQLKGKDEECHTAWGVWFGCSSRLLRLWVRRWMKLVLHDWCDTRPTVAFPATWHYYQIILVGDRSTCMWMPNSLPKVVTWKRSGRDFFLNRKSNAPLTISLPPGHTSGCWCINVRFLTAVSDARYRLCHISFC